MPLSKINPEIIKPDWVSEDYPVHSWPDPEYWVLAGPAVQDDAGLIVCEFSATKSCAFPRAHLIRYITRAKNRQSPYDSLRLEFVSHVVQVTLDTLSAVSLAHGILSGETSVLVAVGKGPYPALPADPNRGVEAEVKADGKAKADLKVCVRSLELYRLETNR